jgi:hypothetical protein
MFTFLKTFDTVIVTGPQRSGTTICAKMIAHDTGLLFFREESFGVFELDELLKVAQENPGAVIQAPALSHAVDRIPNIDQRDDIAIAFMIRSYEEVIASERRIGWGFADHQLANYPDYEPPVCIAKTEHWMTVQRYRIKHAYEVKYHELREHPLWVEDRSGWGDRQIDYDDTW